MIEKIKGFRDFYPEDMLVRENLFGTMRKCARLFGFLPIDYPSLELLDLFRTKSGDELLSQTYSFTDKGKREVTLIPEATPSTVRLMGSRKDLPRPVKWYSIPKLWRYEEPQSGRTREHSQFNADIFGDSSPEADAEIIGLACETLESLGLKGSFEVRINHRQIMEKIMNMLGTKDLVAGLNIIDRYRKETRENMLEELTQNFGSSKNAGLLIEFLSDKSKASEIAKTVHKHFPSLDLSELVKGIDETIRILESWGYSNLVFDPATVRGLTYYTGIVFEGFDIIGKYRSIFGGGRYDNLTGLISGQDMAAVGFGMGDAVLENLLREKELWVIPRERSRYLIIPMKEETRKYALELAGSLRKSGVDCSTMNNVKSLSNSLKSASSGLYTHAIIVGPKEMETGKVTVRDLSSGNQEEKRMDEIH